jgi:hypothetical protein
MPSYNLSTRGRIADLGLGLHVQTGALGVAQFNHSTGEADLFNIYGRIALLQLFVELTSAADANATVCKFRAEFTTPVIASADLSGASASIASLAAYRRIVWVGGAVATATVLTASAGITDVEAAGKIHILGGVSSAGVLTVGKIQLHSGTATQAGTIAATAHMYYLPMCKGAYASAIL